LVGLQDVKKVTESVAKRTGEEGSKFMLAPRMDGPAPTATAVDRPDLGGGHREILVVITSA
jgi:hypothetical protein